MKVKKLINAIKKTKEMERIRILKKLNNGVILILSEAYVNKINEDFLDDLYLFNVTIWEHQLNDKNKLLRDYTVKSFNYDITENTYEIYIKEGNELNEKWYGTIGVSYGCEFLL